MFNGGLFEKFKNNKKINYTLTKENIITVLEEIESALKSQDIGIKLFTRGTFSIQKYASISRYIDTIEFDIENIEEWEDFLPSLTKIITKNCSLKRRFNLKRSTDFVEFQKRKTQVSQYIVDDKIPIDIIITHQKSSPLIQNNPLEVDFVDLLIKLIVATNNTKAEYLYDLSIFWDSFNSQIDYKVVDKIFKERTNNNIGLHFYILKFKSLPDDVKYNTSSVVRQYDNLEVFGKKPKLSYLYSVVNQCYDTMLEKVPTSNEDDDNTGSYFKKCIDNPKNMVIDKNTISTIGKSDEIECFSTSYHKDDFKDSNNIDLDISVVSNQVDIPNNAINDANVDINSVDTKEDNTNIDSINLRFDNNVDINSFNLEEDNTNIDSINLRFDNNSVDDKGDDNSDDNSEADNYGDDNDAYNNSDNSNADNNKEINKDDNDADDLEDNIELEVENSEGDSYDDNSYDDVTANDDYYSDDSNDDELEDNVKMEVNDNISNTTSDINNDIDKIIFITIENALVYYQYLVDLPENKVTLNPHITEVCNSENGLQIPWKYDLNKFMICIDKYTYCSSLERSICDMIVVGRPETIIVQALNDYIFESPDLTLLHNTAKELGEIYDLEILSYLETLIDKASL